MKMTMTGIMRETRNPRAEGRQLKLVLQEPSSSILRSCFFRVGLGLNILQMLGPGKFHEHRHRDSGENRIAGVISQADGQKSEDERLGLFPIPKILVEDIDRYHEKR